MNGKAIVVMAIVCYLAVVGCVLAPGGKLDGSSWAKAEPPARNASRVPLNPADIPYRGVAIQLQRVDWMEKYKQCIDEVVAVGADTVSLVVDSRQENVSSTRIYLDQRTTPSAEPLIDLIKYAKGKKLRVVLMPIVLLDDPGKDWRGTLKPTKWEDWFKSYREMMTQFCWIADAGGVDILVVGSELVSSEDKLDEWTKTINMIRGNYNGRLTYSSNWDHYKSVKFWDQLDLMGMNSYYKLGNDRNVKVEEVERRWREIQEDLLPFARKIDRPILMLEAGWCSLSNAAHEPWDYTQEDLDADPDLQRKLYEGYFRSWWGNPQMGGFMMWEWPPSEGGPKDKGYTPKNKPAERVLKDWLAKPWK